MVTFEELNRLKWQRPFQPFRVTTIENETFEVHSPKLFLVGSNEVNIGLPHPTEPPPCAGEVLWLGLDSIASVELIGDRVMTKFEQLDQLKWQRPFQPFRVTTINNEVYEVLDPGLFLVGGEEVAIGLPHPRKPPPVVRDMVWLWMDSIASVETIGTPT